MMIRFGVSFVLLVLLNFFVSSVSSAQVNNCNPAHDLGNDAHAYVERATACLDAQTIQRSRLPFDEALTQALADATHAIELDPTNPAAFSARGLAYFLSGARGRALVDYTIALQLDPENAEIYARRALTMSGVGDFEGSIQDVSQAINADPQNPEWYFLRAQFYEDAGHHEEALNDLEQILEFAPDDATAYEHTGNIYYDQEQFDLAFQNYQRYVELAESVSPLVNTRLQLLEARQGND